MDTLCIPQLSASHSTHTFCERSENGTCTRDWHSNMEVMPVQLIMKKAVFPRIGSSRTLVCCRLSPLSQKVTLREVREGAGKPLEECLKMEFRMVHHCCTGKTDFTEGVKALLIEKRGQAKWDPASIEQVPAHLIL